MPKPLQPGGVPIWVSGRLNDRVIERIVRFGSGWIPWGDEARDPDRPASARIRDALAAAGRDPAALPGRGPAPAGARRGGCDGRGGHDGGRPGHVRGRRDRLPRHRPACPTTPPRPPISSARWWPRSAPRSAAADRGSAAHPVVSGGPRRRSELVSRGAGRAGGPVRRRPSRGLALGPEVAGGRVLAVGDGGWLAAGDARPPRRGSASTSARDVDDAGAGAAPRPGPTAGRGAAPRRGRRRPRARRDRAGAGDTGGRRSSRGGRRCRTRRSAGPRRARGACPSTVNVATGSVGSSGAGPRRRTPGDRGQAATAGGRPARRRGRMTRSHAAPANHPIAASSATAPITFGEPASSRSGGSVHCTSSRSTRSTAPRRRGTGRRR